MHVGVRCPWFRTVVPDAVWLRAANGTLTVIDLPAPSDDDVATLVRKVCQKVTVVVERWQEVATRYEKLAQNFMGFVLFAAIRVWLA